jgi:ATP-binding cassette subfamily C (CFTR/MRP) protein 4
MLECCNFLEYKNISNFRFLQPLCLKRFLEYYNSQPKRTTKQQACMFALAIVSLNLVRLLYTHLLHLEFASLGMRVRVACSSLMYRKYMKLKRETCQNFTLGQMVNLLSNDVERFQDVFNFLHHAWIGPLKLVVGLYYFDVILGHTAMIGFLIVILFIIMQGKHRSRCFGIMTGHYLFFFMLDTMFDFRH